MEPIGDFVVSTSDDFSGDLFGLSNVLNEFTWSGNDVKWGVFETRWGVHLMPATGQLTHIFAIPTLFPEVIKGVYVEREDGETVFIENPTEKDFDEAHEFVSECATLKELAEKLSPFVKKGSLEFSCWITEVHQGISLERMKICADGSAERSRVVSGAACSYENVMEAVQI